MEGPWHISVELSSPQRKELNSSFPKLFSYWKTHHPPRKKIFNPKSNINLPTNASREIWGSVPEVWCVRHCLCSYPVSLPVSSPWFSATRVWVWGLQNKREINKKRDTLPLTLRCLSLGPAQVEQLLVALPCDCWEVCFPPPSVFGITVHLPAPFLSTCLQNAVSPLHEKGVVANQLFFSFHSSLLTSRCVQSWVLWAPRWFHCSQSRSIPSDRHFGWGPIKYPEDDT